MSNLPWLSPPLKWTIAETAVHVWAARLDRHPAEYDQFWALLAADEQARAKRFYFERDRRHYVAARGLLRTFIAHYLGGAAAAVAFAYGPQGKPQLADTMGFPHFSFNVSHAAGAALFAFGWGRQLGVDVEAVRLLDDTDDVAKRFFSDKENAAYATVPPEQKGQAFFNCWTRKEAFIKAIGEGLSHPLKTFDVSLRPGEPARLLRIDGSETAASRWQMMSLEPFPGYVGAVLAEGQDWQLTCYRWPD
jgi:4'-phosphopantetheinyl transferase